MPWGVAAAAVGAAGAVYSSKQAGKAADKSAKGADAASQVQWDMYDQSRKDQLPWLSTGQNALRQLAILNGVPYATDTPDSSSNFDSAAYLAANPDVAQAIREGGIGGRSFADFGESGEWGLSSNPAYAHWQRWGQGEGRKFYEKTPSVSSAQSTSPDYSAFYNSPDYQFAFDEGNRAAKASLAARGLSTSGRALKELTRYGQGMASQQLNTYRNALAAMAGVGQTAATNVGQQGIQTGQIVGQNTQNAADARASGYLGKSNAWTNAINNGVGMAAYGYGNGWWGSGGDRSDSIINLTRAPGA